MVALCTHEPQVSSRHRAFIEKGGSNNDLDQNHFAIRQTSIWWHVRIASLHYRKSTCCTLLHSETPTRSLGRLLLRPRINSPIDPSTLVIQGAMSHAKQKSTKDQDDD